MWLFFFALLQGTAPPSPQIQADIVSYQEKSGELWAEGHIELRTQQGRLTAQRLNVSQETGWVSAQGQVVIRWADASTQWVVLADLARLRFQKAPSAKAGEGGGGSGAYFEAGELEEVLLENGLWLQKHGVKAEALLASEASEVLKLGKNGLSMRLKQMRRSEGRWKLGHVGFVPCDCDTTQPGWHLESARGSIDIEGQRAELLSTVAYIREVPIFWVPWISLPLSSRQTGLLFPLFSNSANSGFAIRQPVFLTLGRSADLTLTPGWTVGTENAYGVKGPSLGVEFRYAPSESTRGSVSVDWLWDMKAQRSPVRADYTGEGEGKTQRGLRYGLRLNHRQKLGAHGRLLANVGLLSDGHLHRDFEADLILSSLEYTRSQLGLSYEGPKADVLLDIGYLQELRWGHPLFGRAALLAPGEPLRGPNTLQRFPGLSFALREQRLGEGWTFGAQGSFTRLAPWRGLGGDEGPDAREGDDRIWRNGRWETLTIECMRERLYNPHLRTGVCPEEMPALWGKAMQGDGVYQPGEREARDRLGVLPALKYQKRFLGGGAGLSAALALRQDIWLGELSGRWHSRGYPLLKLQADGTLSKEVAEGFWHNLTPQAELRWIAAQWGKAPVGYDEIDLAIPRGYRGLELGVGLRQSLWKRGGSGAAEELLSAELGQAIGIAANEAGLRLGDTKLNIASRWRFLEVSFQSAFEGKRGRFSRLGTALRGQWEGKLGAHIRYDLFRDEGGEESRRGMDMLIGAEPAPFEARHHLGLGVWGKVKGFHFRYQTSFFDIYEKFRLAQHALSIGWTPACNCFGFDLYALQTVTPNTRGGYSLGTPSFGFSFQLQGLGGWGVKQ